MSAPTTQASELPACAAEDPIEEISFENPEIAAMTAICELLRRLPDEAARLRVMRWSFGRFSAEFKRPLADPARDPRPGPAVARPEGGRDSTRGQASPLPHRGVEPAPLAAVAALDVHAVETADFASQLSELNDLFEPVPVLSDEPFF
jgi:hypothetical protein